MTPPAPIIDWAALESAALEARSRAYAPYSRYAVGAALLAASGAIHAGCNVENASYGLCLCAERSAVAHMVGAGDSGPRALVVVTKGPEPGTPCGMCRQVLAEFARDLPILLVTAEEPRAARETSLAALLPDAFHGETLG